MSCGGEATITARVSTQPTDSAVLFCSWFCPCLPSSHPMRIHCRHSHHRHHQLGVRVSHSGMTVDAPPQVAQRTWWCMEELSRVSELNFTYRYVEIDPYEATDGADAKRSGEGEPQPASGTRGRGAWQAK